MAFMAWTDRLSVGVKALDEQHKRLVAALNDLHSSMMSGKGDQESSRLLQTLVQYTHDHFTAEEALMMRTNYPGFEKHIAKHRSLTAEVQNYVSRFQSGEIALNVQLLTFLCDWLTNHIQKEDRDYGPWMNAQGIS